MTRVVIVWTLLALALLSPARSLAQPGDADAIRRASALGAAGDHDGAVRVLRRAQIDTPSPRVDLNLALSLAELGRLRQARALLRRVIASDANPLLVDTAREQLRALDAQLPTLTVRVDESASALRVDSRTFRVDGRVIRVELDPGAHHLELLRADGAVVARTDVELAAAERATVSMRAPRARASRAPERAEPAPVTSAPPVEIAPSGTEAAPAEVSAPPAEAARLELDVVPEPERPAIEHGAMDRADRDDTLLWVLGGAGAAVVGVVVIVAAIAAQPHPTMSDVPPVWVGG